MKGLPRQLGKRPSVGQRAALPLPEPILLRVGGVPDPVDEQIGDVKETESDGIPVVVRWWVVGEVDRAVAIAERYTGQVPEDEHEAPFLKVHVPIIRVRRIHLMMSDPCLPGGDNRFLCL